MADRNKELGNPTQDPENKSGHDPYENEDSFGGGPRGYDANEERYDRSVDKNDPAEKDRLNWGEREKKGQTHTEDKANPTD